MATNINNMETLYTGHIHGFPSAVSKAGGGGGAGDTTSYSIWDEQSGLVALGVVLGSSVSLVGLAFAFITYSLFSDLRSLAGTALLSFLASLFMGQLFFVIGVGGIQDTDLCLSLSMAQMFMKLASLAWLCCCCHHALAVFRNSANLMPVPETHMGKSLAHYSVLSWGFPLLMVAVALAFKYSNVVGGPESYDNGGGGGSSSAAILTHVQIVHATMTKKGTTTATSPGSGIHNTNNHHVSRHNISSVSYAERHCWLMEGPAYLWGFLIPGSVLILLGLWLAFQASDAVKLAASLQVDSRTRNKLLKRRGLQIGLFIKLLILLAFVVVLGAMASLWALPELWALYSIIQGVQGILTAFLVTCNCRVLKLYTVPRHKQQQKYVLKNGCYRSLRDCEKGQYGVLSITNPNYEAGGGSDGLAMPSDEEGTGADDTIYQRSGGGGEGFKVQHPLQNWPPAKGALSRGERQDEDQVDHRFSGRGQNEEQRQSGLANSTECDKSLRNSGEEHHGGRILKSGTIKTALADREVAGGGGGSDTCDAGSGNNKSTIPSLPANGKLSGALSISELPRRPLPRAV